MTIEHGVIENLTQLTPGVGTWLAQTTGNFQAIAAKWPGGFYGIAGETIAVDDAVAYNAGDGKLYKADSNGVSNRFNCVGLARNVATVGQEVVYVAQGPYAFPHGQPAGSPVYLSETPGLLTQTPPAGARIVGIFLPSGLIFLSCPASWRAS